MQSQSKVIKSATRNLFANTILLLSLLFCTQAGAEITSADQSTANVQAAARWSAAKANKWYSEHKWICGANFLPSTAINQLEMWQADTFDSATIDRELGYAEKIGFN